MDKITHHMRRDQWLGLIQQCNASGLSRKDWCQQNGINSKTFYYWQRQLRNEVYAMQVTNDTPGALSSVGVTFAEVAVPDPTKTEPAQVSVTDFQPDAVIRTRTLTIEVSNNASKAVLSLIRSVIKYAT